MTFSTLNMLIFDCNNVALMKDFIYYRGQGNCFEVKCS